MFRNCDGQSVDPVPFLVVTGLSFMGCYSFLPVYCLTLGLPTPVAVAVTTVVFVGLTGGSYYRLVWTARPEMRGEVDPGIRLESIFYLALAVTGVLVFLTLIALAQ